MESFVKLKLIHTGIEPDGFKEVSYQIYHTNDKTTLNQQLILSCEPKSSEWRARIKIDNFPDGLGLSESALKMGEWLTRLGEAISRGEDIYKMTEDLIEEST
jgi:hypothetical protein